MRQSENEGSANEGLQSVQLMGIIADLGTELDVLQPADMDELADFVHDAQDRLWSVTGRPAAALETAPAFPLVRCILKTAAAFHLPLPSPRAALREEAWYLFVHADLYSSACHNLVGRVALFLPGRRQSSKDAVTAHALLCFGNST